MAVHKFATISLCTFLAGASLVLLKLTISLLLGTHYTSFYIWLLICLLYGAVICGILFLKYKNKRDFEVAIRGGCLGIAFSIGFHLASSESWRYFGIYFMALTFFHFSEYFTTAVTNPNSLSLASYLLDHSKEYGIAAIASWIEFSVELFLFPGLKHFHIISIIGLLLVIFGEVIRKGSMYTARTNFNHYVQYVKRAGHELVTHGVYSWCRHPSYVGWFYWSIGTQLLLCNPVCLVAYALVSWRFFNERIQEEEIYLLNFFGEDYVDYKKHVGTGLPFIKGYEGHFS